MSNKNPTTRRTTKMEPTEEQDPTTHQTHGYIQRVPVTEIEIETITPTLTVNQTQPNKTSGDKTPTPT